MVPGRAVIVTAATDRVEGVAWRRARKARHHTRNVATEGGDLISCCDWWMLRLILMIVGMCDEL